jgi:hypothetical protein
MKRKGTAQGTSYSYKPLMPDELMGTTRITVGPTKHMDVMGRKMELTEITRHEEMGFRRGDLSKVQITLYVDADLITRKGVSVQGAERFATVSCSKEEAMKLPTTLPEPVARPWKKHRKHYPTTRSGSTTRSAPTTRRYRNRPFCGNPRNGYDVEVVNEAYNIMRKKHTFRS